MKISPLSTVAKVETEVKTDAFREAKVDCSTISDMPVEVTIINIWY